MPSKRPLSESKIRAASLRELLLTTRDMARAGGRYTHAGVIGTFIELPEVKALLDEERMLWIRTAASKILADAIRAERTGDVAQFELFGAPGKPATVVELAGEYTVPVGAPEPGEPDEEDIYHVARGLMLVSEHAAHVAMRRQQQNADEAILTREERTAAILKAAGAGAGDRVVDVLRRLARPH